jgi:hypothetical protein
LENEAVNLYSVTIKALIFLLLCNFIFLIVDLMKFTKFLEKILKKDEQINNKPKKPITLNVATATETAGLSDTKLNICSSRLINTPLKRGSKP